MEVGFWVQGEYWCWSWSSCFYAGVYTYAHAHCFEGVLRLVEGLGLRWVLLEDDEEENGRSVVDTIMSSS